MKKVSIYTDGSCLGNPGPGGYGALLEFKQQQKEISQGFQNTTNNRMELLAPIAALSLLKEPCEVNLYTDSQYLKNGIQQWIKKWQQNGWKTAAKKDVKNVDLWKQLDQVVNQHTIHWHWVKAHNGHPQNERVDDLARLAASGDNLLPDKGFVV